MTAAEITRAHVCTEPAGPLCTPGEPVRVFARIDLELFAEPMPEHPQAPADAKFWADAARWKLALLQAQLRLNDQVLGGRGVPSALARTLEFAAILIADSIAVSVDHHEDLGGDEGAALRGQLELLQHRRGRPVMASTALCAATAAMTGFQKKGGNG